MSIAEFLPFSPFEDTRISERNLPHWNQEGRMYFITFRLADSIPAVKIAQYKAERDSWLAKNPEPLTKVQVSAFVERFPDRFHMWLDAGAGACLLRSAAISNIVEQALLYFDSKRYILDSYVVMPNHVHVLAAPLNDFSLSRLLHSWKSYTAHEINKRLDRKGTVWQDESYDHVVRSMEQLLFYRDYIEENPVKANLREGEYRIGSGIGVKIQQPT
jgi:REP element-mobilizing transposase RayT